MPKAVSRLEQAKQDHSLAMFFLTLRDVYFAFYLYLNFVLPPINEQSEERETDKTIGLVVIIAMVGLAVTFEGIKYKKFLSPALETQLDRIWRHGINGIKDIAIILAFMGILAQLLMPTEGEPKGLSADIINAANWLAQANIFVKLGISVPLIAAKGLASFFLNRKEYQLIKPTEEESTVLINTKDLNERRFTPLTALRVFGQLSFMYLKGVNFAAVDLSLIQDFNVQIPIEVTQRYLWAKPLVQVLLYGLLWDHPAYRAENLRKFGRFLHRFFTLAVENAEITFAIILNFLSFRSDQTNLSDSSALTLLASSYLLATFLSESHFRLTSLINDKALPKKIMLTPTVLEQLAQGGLIASAVFPNTLIAWPGIVAFSILSFVMKLVKTPEESSKLNKILSLPQYITQQLAWGAAALVLLETGTGSLELLYKLLMVAPAAILFAGMSYFEDRRKPLEIINESLKAGLLGGLAITTIETAPMLELNRNYGLPLAGFLASGLLTAARQSWNYRKQQQQLPAQIQEAEPNEQTESQFTFKPLAKGLFTLFSLWFAYSMAEKYNDSGDTLSGPITTYLLLLVLAATATYQQYWNEAGKNPAAALFRCSIFQPQERYELPDGTGLEPVREQVFT